MQLTRREFLMSGAVGIGAASLPIGLSPLYAAAVKKHHPAAAAAPVTLSAHSALARMAYGATPAETSRLRSMGLTAYLDEQLNPHDPEDTVCNAQLAATRMHMEYPAGDGYPAMKEDRPLRAIYQSVEELWPLTDNKTVKRSGEETNLPAMEVRTATWVRAVYSKWQLREVMVEFWHNHFNVDAFSNPRINVTFPAYDSVMRQHCFGNFREFIGDIARSPAMLYFLNNDKSRASPANENYAREMFELHTLGAPHYYNNVYNRWREVPGATEGLPIGYIDQDVYEAARAFTGWTVEDGTNTGHGTLPNTGKFTYFDGWHDNYQKRVLAQDFDPNAAPMVDGNKVLDLVSNHPGTAMYLCTKLCRRFISDEPPPDLVKRAAQIWLKNGHRSDQIAQVLRTIILSSEFAATRRAKVKRPPELVASFVRATGASFTPNRALINTMPSLGYRQFQWQTPTGHPDVAEFWLNTNTVLGSWNLLQNLPGMKVITLDAMGQTPEEITTAREIVTYWYERMTGYEPDAGLTTALLHELGADAVPDAPLARTNPDARNRLNRMVTLIAMLPDFQWRG